VTAGTIAGLAHLFLGGVMAGALLQVSLLAPPGARITQDQARARRLFFLDGWLAVFAMGLTALLRLADILGIETSIIARFVYVALLLGSMRLLLTMPSSVLFSRIASFFVFAAAMALVLPLEPVLGSALRFSPAGIIEPVRGVFFLPVIAIGMLVPLHGMLVSLKRRQFGSGFLFCSGIVLAVLVAGFDLPAMPELMAAVWFGLVASRLFRVKNQTKTGEGHVTDSPKRSTRKTRT